jgi:hypothetical protein
MIGLLPFLSKVFLLKILSDTRVWLETSNEHVPRRKIEEIVEPAKR